MILYFFTELPLIPVLYGFSLSYVLSPSIGASFTGAELVEFVHSFPEWFKYSTKALLAAPFAYHAWNGVRHLLWDSGKCEFDLVFFSFFQQLTRYSCPVLSLKGAYTTGYVVLGATAVTTVGLLFM